MIKRVGRIAFNGLLHRKIPERGAVQRRGDGCHPLVHPWADVRRPRDSVPAKFQERTLDAEDSQ
jgi:hypothetical protein